MERAAQCGNAIGRRETPSVTGESLAVDDSLRVLNSMMVSLEQNGSAGGNWLR